ncbi:Z1 domain-containing protein [Ralstonia insidiosa]|uniref:Z1 domain-containing protein n=1 Tax=Ralstonia insidiosa TaxID=190721 RepID=UPI000CEF2BA4|nr:Z1 domain-containing protein [Ralstonia insidiosa]
MSVVVKELKDVHPPLLWEPAVGAETDDFVKRKHANDQIPHEALQRVVFEAQQILGRCVDPKEGPAGATGLAVGYVQSGKTLSFTTLAALARDNGYGMVILIAGVLDNLLKQTLARLSADLNLSGGLARPWVLIDRPTPDKASETQLRQHLAKWSDPSLPAQKKRTVMVVVLKNHKRMANLRECLADLDLTAVPTLVIDDEADQASLNNFADKNRRTGSNKKSTNYGEVTELKDLLPHHTYVQYTATPQAPLLVGLSDALSPRFAELLSPGDGYVGGKVVFAPLARYARTIPEDEADATLATSPDGPPATLVEALRTFLLGACAVEASGKVAHRTMMIHPSQQTELHSDYQVWLAELIREWRSMVTDPALRDDFFKDFHKAHADLAETVGNALASLDELVAHMPYVLKTVNYREVNSTGPGSEPVDWSGCEYWILVGGAKLDRGYTVEGLTVTYMPRPIGTGNADNLQQRARFYGYKQKYIGYCRVYLRRSVKDAFRNYVEHEEAIHESLRKTRGHPLSEWNRQFTLDRAMSPTRKSVIGITLDEVVAANWVTPKAAHVDTDCVATNRNVFNEFVVALGGLESGVPANKVDSKRYIDKRPDRKNILFESVPLGTVIDNLLERLRMGDGDDAVTRVGCVLALRQLVKDGQTHADVFLIGELEPQKRSKTKSGVINQVFQGKNPDVADRSKLLYGGDRDFASESRVSLHLRTFNLLNPETKTIEEADVPWFAMHVPESLKKRLLIQAEGV